VKLALECPTPLISEIQPLGDFDFALSHLVHSDSAYAEYYTNSKRKKILDNSTNELLHPVSLLEIKMAADIIHPDLVVAPDYLGDVKSTLKSLEATLKLCSMGRVLPVVQGRTLLDIISCLNTISDMGFDRVAVPFDIMTTRTDKPTLTEMAACRKVVVQKIELNFYSLDKVHLLGMTTLEELSSYSHTEIIESVDTGSPVLHGLKGLRYGVDCLLPKYEPTMNQMPENTSAHQGQLGDVFRNIAFLRKYTNK